MAVKSKLDLVDGKFQHFSLLLNVIGSAWIFFLVLIIVLDVVARTVVNHPLTGIPEIVSMSLVGITFLQITHAKREGRHIRATIFLDRAPRLGKKVLEIINNLLSLVLFILIFYSSWAPALKSWAIGEFVGGQGSVRVPVYPIRTLILLGSLMMIIQFVFDLLKLAKNKSFVKEDQ